MDELRLKTQVCNAGHMCCKMSKPGPCRHLSFATNPVFSNFIGKVNLCNLTL